MSRWLDIFTLSIMGWASVAQASLTSPSSIVTGECNGRTITVHGVISAYERDNYDASSSFFVLQTTAGPICLAIPTTNFTETAAHALIDAEIEATGTASRFELWRNQRQTYISLRSGRHIKVTRAAPSDPFSAQHSFPNSRLHKVCLRGTVIQTGINRVFFRGDTPPELVTATLAPSHKLKPHPGEHIVAAGFLGDGRFGLHMTEASVRREGVSSQPLEKPSVLASADELFVPYRRPIVVPYEAYHGKRIQIVGKASRTSSNYTIPDSFGLDCGSARLTIDTTDLSRPFTDSIKDGSTIAVTGLCVFEFSTPDPQTPMPQFRSITLVPADDGGIVILKQPPWWTPGRLWIAIGILLLILIGAAVLTGILARLVEKRSRLLLRKEAETIRARLQATERTRLATELHDSVVQNLTGAAMEILSAQASLRDSESESAPHLDTALKTVNSSRAELRNCIWDLRNKALEQNDIDAAVRITLQPHLRGARLMLRFNVSRRIIPDNEFHSILCIIRELVINAIRHGGASTIKIAGASEGGRILFSVTDNGCGFKPDDRPGMEQGHFGLEGIIERARALGGTISIDSAPGRGTCVTANIALPENS